MLTVHQKRHLVRWAYDLAKSLRLNLDTLTGCNEFLGLLEGRECRCKRTPRPSCVFTFGAQGCRPRCVTPTNPGGCKTECMTPQSPRGCRMRRQTGSCHCCHARCGCPKGTCDCPRSPGPPCSHVKASGYGLELEQQLYLQRLLSPDCYGDVKEDTTPSLAITRQARVALYRKRQRDGRSLFRQGDLYSTAHERRDVGVSAPRGPNGRCSLDETLVTGEEQ